jgi:hypothetical protein
VQSVDLIPSLPNPKDLFGQLLATGNQLRAA